MSIQLDEMFMQVVHLHHHRAHNLLNDIGLYRGRPHILFYLQDHRDCSQKQLADHMRLKPATVTVVLGRMEKDELIERRQDEVDARVSRVNITQKGLDLCQKATEQFALLREGMYKDFSQEEIELLLSFYGRMRANLTVNEKKG